MKTFVWAVLLLAGLVCSPISADNLGEQSSIEEYPYLVQVEFRVLLAWLQQCVGSVLNAKYILSAASCFSGDSFSIGTRRIRAGSSYRGVGGTVKELEGAHVYPTYGQLGQDGDLAVVVLSDYLIIGPTIQPTPILGEGIELPAGLNLDVASWGTTTQGGANADGEIYSLSLYTVQYDSCINVFYDRQTITENMVCAGLRSTNGRDLDTRDVGAPIFYSGVAVGVVSFGVANGEDAYPVVSTAIASYTSWIQAMAAP